MRHYNLTNQIRDQIVNKLLVHTFQEREQNLRKSEIELGDRVYNAVYAKQLDVINSLPEGYLPTDCSVGLAIANAPEKCIRLKLPNDRRMPMKDTRFQNIHMVVDPDHEFAKAFDDYITEKVALNVERKEASSNARSILATVNTSKQLLDLWPEVEPFLPLREEKHNLPVDMSSLNKTFKLPVAKAA